MRKLYLDSLRRTLNLETPSRHILDIGCGTGIITKSLEKIGKVVGVDKEKTAIEFCKKRRIVNLIIAHSNRLPFKESSFDIICAFNIIEHLKDDVSFIEEMHRVCKKGGRIFFATSAFKFLWSEHDCANEHQKRYTVDGLKKILGTKFEIEKITYTNFFLFPIVFLITLFKKLDHRCRKIVSRSFYPVPRVINQLLIGLLYLESGLIKYLIFPWGVSILCVARKNEPRDKKILIVNADDFGLTAGINRGIIKAFRQGAVRSASIMAVGRCYEDAVRLTKENPDFDIGIHLCLTEEKPILTKEKVSSLIGKDGHFFKTPVLFILNYLLGRIKHREIEGELDAQIRKVLNSGIKITHIDSHCYVHMLPFILKMVGELAKKYGISFIRYPYEHFISGKVNLSRRLIHSVLNISCLLSRQTFKRMGISRVDYFYGFLNSGMFSAQYLMHILKAVDNGITEIVCHPGLCDEEVTRYRYWRYHWEEELEVLTSPDINKIINESGLELIGFKDVR